MLLVLHKTNNNKVYYLYENIKKCIKYAQQKQQMGGGITLVTLRTKKNKKNSGPQDKKKLSECFIKKPTANSSDHMIHHFLGTKISTSDTVTEEKSTPSYENPISNTCTCTYIHAIQSFTAKR